MSTATNTGRVTPDQRHTRRDPCSICGGGGDDRRGRNIRCTGFRSSDPRHVFCSREEYAGPRQAPTETAAGPAFKHWVGGGRCNWCGATHPTAIDAIGPQASMRRPAASRAQPARPARPPLRNAVRTEYPAIDASGAVVAVHVRIDGLNEEGRREKRMWWERNGSRTLDGHPLEALPLYGLPDLLAAPPGARVYVCEGEKATDALRQRGILAVGTMTGGDGTPCDDSLRPLLGHDVVVWADADRPDGTHPRGEGQQHMERLSARLVALGAPPHRWVCWLAAPPKGDAADYLGGGGTIEGLAELVVSMPPSTDTGTGEAPSNSEQDDEPDDLPPAPPSDSVLPFPVEVLPAPLRQFVEAGAKAIGCPTDYLAVPMLVLLGNAIGNSRTLRIKGTWHEAARLWAAIIGLPGDKKSPALELAYRAFERCQRLLETRWRQALAEYQARDPDERHGEPEPQLQQIMTTDATLEALADLLESNGRGILFMQDELAAWALAMNQYKGKGADRKHWLGFWNGKGGIVNRRNRARPVVLHQPFVGVVGGLQPDVLADLSDERGHQDGFVHRILFAYPDSAPLVWTDDDVAQETLAAYDAAFDHLWQLQPVTDEHGEQHPEVVAFTTEGRTEWVTWITAHYREVDASGFPEPLRGPWAKLVSYAARCALILQASRVACGEAQGADVDEVSMAGAASIIRYFKGHARRTYAHLHATAEDKQVVAAVTWIRRQPEQTTTSRDLLRANVAGVQTTDEALELVAQLVERGYGVATKTLVHGGQRVVFKMHPTPDR